MAFLNNLNNEVVLPANTRIDRIYFLIETKDVSGSPGPYYKIPIKLKQSVSMIELPDTTLTFENLAISFREMSGHEKAELQAERVYEPVPVVVKSN